MANANSNTVTSNLDANTLYKKHQNLIRSRAWHFSRTYFADFNELELEGNLVFAKAVQTFDPSKGTQFQTYLYQALNHLGNVGKKEFRKMQHHVIDDDVALTYDLGNDLDPVSNTPISWETRRKFLGEDTLFLLDLLKSGEASKDCEYQRVPKQTTSLRKVKPYLKELGWRYSRIENAISELREAWELHGESIAAFNRDVHSENCMAY